MEMLTPELISGVGSGGAVLFLAIYFLRAFIDYQKTVITDILTEMRADRQVFQEAVNKLDARLHLIERLIERDK